MCKRFSKNSTLSFPRSTLSFPRRRESSLVLTLIIFLLFTAGCGTPEISGGEDYGDLEGSPTGYDLTLANHGDGWKRGDCAVCHNFYNIHFGVSAAGYDLAVVREIVERDGQTSCLSGCHGTNGVQ